MAEWQEKSVAEIAQIIGGGTPKTTKPEYWGGVIPWLSVVDFNNQSRWVFNTEKTITEAGLQNSSTKILKKGQLILSARGTVGALAQLGKDMAFNQSCYGLDAKSESNNDYLYYALLYTVEDIRRNTHGAVFDTITRDTLSHIKIPLPPLPEQQAIAGVLSALDEKIELNRRMNATLEAMARALFKSWFVDFIPVRAKMEGRAPDGLSADIAALFPDTLVDSPLGEIPNGWEVKPLGDYVSIKRGGSPRPIHDYLATEGLPWVKIADATASDSPFLLETNQCIKKEGLKKTVFLKKGELILSNSATPGLPKFLNLDACIHDGWLYFPEKRLFDDYYLYQLFLVLREEFISKGNGSVFTNLKTDIIKTQNVVVPSKNIISAFELTAQSLFQRILANVEENQTLSQLRDTLLPKLISGQLRVTDTASSIKEAV